MSAVAEKTASSVKKTASSYKTIKTVVNVRVKVPQEGKQMKRVEAHTFESADGPISVSLHWRNGILLQDAGGVISKAGKGTYNAEVEGGVLLSGTPEPIYTSHSEEGYCYRLQD